jgi:hypothetical protein
MSRSQIFVEKAQPEDSDALIAAMDSTPDNLCDPKIFGYSTLSVLKAVRDDKPLIFMPFQICYVLESLAICEGNSELDTALSLSELVKTVRWEAHCKGIKEILFICKESSTIAFAKKHGFDELLFDKDKNIGLYRMSL